MRASKRLVSKLVPSLLARKEGKIKTLTFPKGSNPVMSGSGWYTDVNGIRWDVWGAISGNGISMIWARMIDELPLYSTQPSFWINYSASWDPYYLEIEGGDIEDVEPCHVTTT
jgi:hypothetical protein